jgi:hypothetical protein
MRTSNSKSSKRSIRALSASSKGSQSRSRSRSKSPSVIYEDRIRSIPRPLSKTPHPFEVDQTHEEQLLAKVYEIAANSLPQNVSEPGLSELTRALDLIAESNELHQEMGYAPAADMVTKVHRLLLRSQR